MRHGSSSASTAARWLGNSFPVNAARFTARAILPALASYARRIGTARAAASADVAAWVMPNCESQWARWRTTLHRVRNRLMRQAEPTKMGTVRLSEKALRKYVDDAASLRGSGPPPDLSYSAGDIKVCKDIPASARGQLMELFKKYEPVFQKHKNELPRPILAADGTEYVHSYDFIPNARPTRVRCPEWPAGSARRQVLEEWCEASLASGLIEPSPGSLWASRVLCVPKYAPDGIRDGAIDSIRVVGDFVAANGTTQRIVPVGQHVHLELARVAGHAILIEGAGGCRLLFPCLGVPARPDYSKVLCIQGSSRTYTPAVRWSRTLTGRWCPGCCSWRRMRCATWLGVRARCAGWRSTEPAGASWAQP